MSSTENPLVNDLMTIHAEMCMVWGMNPYNADGVIWSGNTRPPWLPMWKDFLMELSEDQCDLCYKSVFPQDEDSVPSLTEMGNIGLEVEHLHAICRVVHPLLNPRAEITEEVMGPVPPQEPQDTESHVQFMSPRRLTFTEDSSEEGFDDTDDEYPDLDLEAIVRYESQHMEHPEPTRNPVRLENCQRGLSIIEDAMEKGIPLTEGMYLELSNILQRLSA